MSLFHLVIVCLSFGKFGTANLSHNNRANGSNVILVANGTQSLTAANGNPAIFIFDYGRSVEGIPTFEIVGATGDTSRLEVTYAESKASLDNYMSDGPLPLAAAMDTYRINRYNITTSPGTIHGRLIQGAFRYQKFNLSTTGNMVIRNVGVRPAVDSTPISELPGSFQSSSSNLNRIWTVGARTIQMTEIPQNSIPDFVHVTGEGTLIQSLAPQVLGFARAAQLTHYNMSFQVKPLIGGFGFTVLSDTLNSGIYFSCDVEQQKITVHRGSTAEDAVLGIFDIPKNASVLLQKWVTVKVSVSMTNITMFVDSTRVLELSQSSRFFGSFGLGASFGHSSLFRYLGVVTAAGDDVYSHSLTNRRYLADFFMGSNPHDTSVDGSRRDRIAYAGDLDVAGRATLVSTHGLSYVTGSLNLLGSYQASPGFFIPTAKIQQQPLHDPLDVNVTGLIGYSFNFLNGLAATYMHTGDVGFAKKWASPIQRMLDWAHSQTLENGLLNISDASFGGDWNYYDPAQSGVVTKFNVLYAYSLQECAILLRDAGINTEIYDNRIKALRTAIDENLWSDDLKAYYLSESIQNGYAQDANALAILAGVNINPAHSTETILGSLKKLVKPAGPLAFSHGVISAGFQPYISPYASSYHLRAALASNDAEGALELLNHLWLPMTAESNDNYTGTFWETLDEDGRPGLGLITSLCHGWAAGPTAELSTFVLGARPVKPGWLEFEVAPITLGLLFAKGRLPTMSGTIHVEWRFGCDGLVKMVVEAPVGTKGTVELPRPLLVPLNESTISVNGRSQTGPEFWVKGGEPFVLQQTRKK